MKTRSFVTVLIASLLATPVVAQKPAAWSAPAAAAALPPNFDQFFNDSVVHDVQLLVNSRDLAQLYATYTANTYYPADFIWDGIRVRNVAIRSRGSGSRNPFKLGLKVDFNRYVTGRTFAGLSALVMDNLWQDPSLIREKVAMKLFDRLGQPTPREAFCRFYINGQYQGLYAMIEPIDAAFITRALQDPTGYLFEYNWVDYYYGTDLGNSLSPYKSRFQAQTRDKESDTILYSPIRSLFQEANHPVDAVWRDRVDSYMDLDQLIGEVARETFVSEIDGIIGAWGMDNFYMERPAGSTRHRVIPWDKDVAFNAIDSPIDAGLDSNVLVRNALTYDDLRAHYNDVLEQCAVAAGTDDWLLNEVNREWALVADAAHADTKKQFSNALFDEQIEFLRAFASQRPAFVLQAVAVRRQNK